MTFDTATIAAVYERVHRLAVRPPLFHEVLTPHVCSERFRRVCAWLGPVGREVAAQHRARPLARTTRWSRWRP